VAYNQMGRFQASIGDYKKAGSLYEQAVEIDPNYIEATSNKGVAFEKQGMWDQALESYRKAEAIDKSDVFASVLAGKAEEMLALKNDTAKKERIDKLVKDLAERYRKQKKTASKSEDIWTSRPMVMTFVDFNEKGGLPQRDGISMVLTTQLADMLNTSGRIKVVERVLMERLLEELNIGSSELADPETALKLGKVFAAKIISTGSLFFMPNATMLNLRLIDTETSAIAKVITREIKEASMEQEIRVLNRNILKTVIEKYPLQGYVVSASDSQAMINLGSNQGVVLGTKFEVIEEKAPVKYKGKMLESLPEIIAQLEITKVEPDLSHARIVEPKRPVKTDDKIKEKIDDLVAMGVNGGTK
jgi:tetratricopeptide (TPR) repeat protein